MVLNYTWDDVEAELVLRNLEEPAGERQRLQTYYLKLREECRTAAEVAKSLFQVGND